ncbi:MAG: prepilin-type N-terminal cleavage/methylation domain-containing protein [Rickettsiales bacterium]|nr:prepilin-type N-terminal cleavage/methylation domain-containing protein [Rickettsiales bacterium]
MHKKDHKAFSLIELSLVVLVVGILIAAISQGQKLFSKSKLVSARTLTKSSPVAGIKDLALWFDTTAETSFIDAETNDGNTISSWYSINPQLPNKFVASQYSSYKPIYKEQGINGLPALIFRRTDDNTGTYLAVPYNPTFHPSQLTVFVVVATRSVVSYGAIFSARSNSGSSLSGYTLYAYNRTYQLWIHGGTSYGLNPIYSNIILDSPDILTGSYDGTAMAFYDGGTAVSGSPETKPYTVSTTPDFRIGIGSNLTGSSDSPTFWPYDGYIGEIILYSRFLKTEERKAIEKYLGQKWGISVAS